MPNISLSKRERISEQVIHFLFSVSPSAKFTSEIAKELARDEEFTKKILKDLKEKGLIIEVNKNSLGLEYLRRQRWLLSPKAYEIYKNHQNTA